jgi:hypothetical protein
MAPDFYGPYVVYERKEKFYVELLKALYGMLIASLPPVKKDLGRGLQVQPYDPCKQTHPVETHNQDSMWMTHASC